MTPIHTPQDSRRFLSRLLFPCTLIQTLAAYSQKDLPWSILYLHLTWVRGFLYPLNRDTGSFNLLPREVLNVVARNFLYHGRLNSGLGWLARLGALGERPGGRLARRQLLRLEILN